MLQRTAGTFIAKKIKDEFFAPPKTDEDDEPEQQRQAPVQYQPQYANDSQDGAEYRDEEGHLIGYTRRVADLAVYAVTSSHGSPHAALSEALRDPNSQLVFQSTNGRISALIYVPDPDRVSGSSSGDSHGFRADDV